MMTVHRNVNQNSNATIATLVLRLYTINGNKSTYRNVWFIDSGCVSAYLLTGGGYVFVCLFGQQAVNMRYAVGGRHACR